MSKTIYVASGLSERHATRDDIEALTAAGWLITYNWTTEPLWSVNRPLTSAERRTLALKDRQAVYEARVFWYRIPTEKSEGAADEHGYVSALRDCGQHNRVIVVSGDIDSLGRIFPHVSDPQFLTHAAALQWLCKWSGK